jgi:hypothetical protein
MQFAQGFPNKLQIVQLLIIADRIGSILTQIPTRINGGRKPEAGVLQFTSIRGLSDIVLQDIA